MRTVELIMNKKRGMELSPQEIDYLVSSFASGDIPDYQMSAFLMAVCFNGMNRAETSALTMSMARSGDILDLSEISGIKADKHSTGGVGDKTTFIVLPIVASCGIPIAKMSGRGLGHTGGTIDKLESIPGFKTSFTTDEFIDIVKNIGVCIAGQSANLAPADKKIYALRDVTATVDCLPLIASSVMSKKIASGADCIVLDIKAGSGAFMKTTDDAIALALEMVSIGNSVGRKTSALITSMDQPLGNAVGNSLEIAEAVSVLKGGGPEDLKTVSLALAKEMLILSGKGSPMLCEALVNDAVFSGKAFNKFVEMVEAQGGDTKYIQNTDLFQKAAYCGEITSSKTGYVFKIDAEMVGNAACVSGAGRETYRDNIDFSAGIILNKKIGDFVREGEKIADVFASSKERLDESIERLMKAIVIDEAWSNEKPIIFAKINSDGQIEKEA